MSAEYEFVGVRITEADLLALKQGVDAVWLSGHRDGRFFGDESFALTDGTNYLWAHRDSGGVIDFLWRAGQNDPRNIIVFLMDRFGIRLKESPHGYIVSRGDE